MMATTAVADTKRSRPGLHLRGDNPLASDQLAHRPYIGEEGTCEEDQPDHRPVSTPLNEAIAKIEAAGLCVDATARRRGNATTWSIASLMPIRSPIA